MAVIINQVAMDYANITIDLGVAGESFGIVGAGCHSMNYSWSVEREKMYGGSRLPVDRTEGEGDFDGSMTFHRYWYDFIVKRAAELGLGIAQIEMTLGVSYAKGSLPIVTDTLTGVAFAGGDHANERGPEVLKVECGLDIMNIYYDGIDIFGGRL